MVMTAVIFFALAAVGGIILAYLHLSKKNAPIALAVLHGLLAATGLIILIIAAVGGESNWMVVTAIVVFLVAAIGGITLFTFHLLGRPLPPALIVIHGLAAVTGFVFTFIAAVTMSRTGSE